MRVFEVPSSLSEVEDSVVNGEELETLIQGDSLRPLLYALL